MGGAIISPVLVCVRHVMAIPLQNARLCLDCDTVFEGSQCPGCSSQSFFPLSRWVRPAVASDAVKVSNKAKKISFILLGSAAGFALWQFLKKPVRKFMDD